MKILHVLYSGLGGHGNVFFSMADADHSGENKYEALFFGIEDVREGYIEKARARGIPYHFVKKKPGIDLSSRRRIKRIIRESKPDIIFIHGSSFIFYVNASFSFFRNPPIVVRETQPNHLKTKQEWSGLAYALLFAAKVVFLSTEFRDAIKLKLPLFFSGRRTTVIPNGIDLALYSPKPIHSERFIRIGMQSRLSATKDHATLIKAFSQCIKNNNTGKKIQLLIAGDGICRSALEKLTEDLNLGDNIIFTGMLEETELPDFINSLDIYVHATLGETMSTAIMQVMACRLPIIASDVLGVNNMIKNRETGLLVPAADEKKLAEAILHMINNPLEAEQLAENAYRFALNNYGNTLMLARYQKVFSEA